MDLFDIRKQLYSGKSIFDMPMRVTYYARVSTDKDEQLNSLSVQVSYYSDFIKNNPHWTFVDGYVDEGLSGVTVSKRESFLRMIEDAKAGKFDFIITKEISRFSRNTLDSIKYTQELLDAGVGVLFQSDNINTLFPDSELRLTIMSSIAQDEVRRISERVRFGFKRAIEKGVVLGNENLWGYTKSNGKLTIEEDEAEIIRLIFHLYANENKGTRTIESILAQKGYKNSNGKNFGTTTIRNVLANPKYKGYYCGNKTHKYDYRKNTVKMLDESEWVMYKDEENVPPIVSEELWDKANAILKERSERMKSDVKSGYNNRYAYSGKIICMEHNIPYYHVKFSNKDEKRSAWCCKIYRKQGRVGCPSPSLFTSELDEIMKYVMGKLAIEKETIINYFINLYRDINENVNLEDELSKVKRKVDEITKMKNKLLDLSVKGMVEDEEFTERNNKFNVDMKKLRSKESELEEQIKKNVDFNQRIDAIRKVVDEELSSFENLSDGLIQALLERIEVYTCEDKNEVRLKVFIRLLDSPYGYLISRKKKNGSTIKEINYPFVPSDGEYGRQNAGN